MITTKIDCDVCVIGGGISSLAVSLMLLRQGLTVANVRQPSKGYHSHRTIALSAGTLDLLRDASDGKIGLEKLGNTMENIAIYDAKKLMMTFAASDLGADYMGRVLYVNELVNVLDSFLAGHQNFILLQTDGLIRPQDLGLKTKISLSSSSLEAKFCFVADTNCVDLAIITEELSYNYNQVALMFNVHHKMDHDNCAVERFMPHGPLALLPIEKHTSSVIWTVSTAMAEELTTMSRADVSSAINLHVDDIFGSCEVASDLAFYPLKFSKKIPDRMGRIFLIGGASQSIHPIAGQGFNLIVRNLHKSTENISDSLYRGKVNADKKTTQIVDNLAMFAGTHLLNSLFHGQSQIVKTLRFFGMSVLDATNIPKKMTINYAMGRSPMMDLFI